MSDGRCCCQDVVSACLSQMEVRDSVALKVNGTLPSWLSGALIRNGPGTFDIPISDGKRKGTTYTFKHMCDVSHDMSDVVSTQRACAEVSRLGLAIFDDSISQMALTRVLSSALYYCKETFNSCLRTCAACRQVRHMSCNRQVRCPWLGSQAGHRRRRRQGDVPEPQAEPRHGGIHRRARRDAAQRWHLRGAAGDRARRPRPCRRHRWQSWSTQDVFRRLDVSSNVYALESPRAMRL